MINDLYNLPNLYKTKFYFLTRGKLVEGNRCGTIGSSDADVQKTEEIGETLTHASVILLRREKSSGKLGLGGLPSKCFWKLDQKPK